MAKFFPKIPSKRGERLFNKGFVGNMGGTNKFLGATFSIQGGRGHKQFFQAFTKLVPQAHQGGTTPKRPFVF